MIILTFDHIRCPCLDFLYSNSYFFPVCQNSKFFCEQILPPHNRCEVLIFICLNKGHIELVRYKVFRYLLVSHRTTVHDKQAQPWTEWSWWRSACSQKWTMWRWKVWQRTVHRKESLFIKVLCSWHWLL